jgi:hypothetical protein
METIRGIELGLSGPCQWILKDEKADQHHNRTQYWFVPAANGLAPICMIYLYHKDHVVKTEDYKYSVTLEDGKFVLTLKRSWEDLKFEVKLLNNDANLVLRKENREWVFNRA